MEPIKPTLYPHCTECPAVEITDQGVTIGEGANTVRLFHVEWNESSGDQARRVGRDLKRFVLLPAMAVEALSGSPGSEVVAQSDRQKLPARIWGPALADVRDVRAVMQLHHQFILRILW